MKNNLFEEIYSSFYNVISYTLAEVINNPANSNYDILPLINEFAKLFSAKTEFADGIGELVIDESNLVTDGKVNLKHTPSLPLTTIQKRWLKSLLYDPRIKLFDIDINGLEDVDPLYKPETIVYYDQYNNGDDYSSETYIKVFRTILQAIKTESKVRITKTNNKGKITGLECWPLHLEYSSKNDKFRVLVSKDGNHESYNISFITDVVILDESAKTREKIHQPKTEYIELEIRGNDTTDTINRCMFYFSDYKKETDRIDQDKYQVKIYYDQSDERELIIRVLQLGAKAKVIGPPRFKKELIKRINNQKSAD